MDLDLFFWAFPCDGLIVIIWHPLFVPVSAYSFFNN